MAESARLKTGRKKMKSSPPKKGNQVDNVPRSAGNTTYPLLFREGISRILPLPEKAGNLHKCAVAENKPVKGAVDDVPDCPGNDERDAEYQSVADFFPRYLIQPPADNGHCYDAKQAQEELSEITSQFHSESHSFVFREMDIKPMTGDGNVLTQGHMCFHPDFQDLIKDQDEDDDDGSFSQNSIRMII